MKKPEIEIMEDYEFLTESFEDIVRAQVSHLAPLFDEKDIAEIGSGKCARIALMLAVCKAGSMGLFPHDSDSRRVQQRIQRRIPRETRGKSLTVLDS